MSDILLKNLEIRSFRGFRHLKIERLGRVNLIVGKNNVGKTALLEALHLYASRRSVKTILELLGVNDETKQFVDLSIPEERLAALKYSFYGRQDVRLHLESIQIGPIDSEAEKLTINVGWNKLEFNERGERFLRQMLPEEYNTADKLSPYLDMRIEGKDIIYSLDWIGSAPPFRQVAKRVIGIFIGPHGLNKREIGSLWDGIALTDLEQEVLATLRIIAPGVERLNLVADDGHPSERVPIVKITDIDEPLPLSNLGDGMQRMLGITLALVNAKGGMVLIDEIENGLHYSAQPDMWRIIFQLARRLNIQVFATSHSWDCIEAFQQAAEEDKQTEGLLIRLEYKNGEVIPTLFDERKLDIATREQIEVR